MADFKFRTLHLFQEDLGQLRPWISAATHCDRCVVVDESKLHQNLDDLQSKDQSAESASLAPSAERRRLQRARTPHRLEREPQSISQAEANDDIPHHIQSIQHFPTMAQDRLSHDEVILHSSIC